MKNRKCRDCDAFAPDTEGSTVGVCAYKPPVPARMGDNTPVTAWPTVHADLNWCGSFFPAMEEEETRLDKIEANVEKILEILSNKETQ